MASSPKQTTTKTEPWDGAKPYITKYLAQADKLFEAGAPKVYEGSTVADQSKATLDAQNQAEAIARGGFGGGIKNAQNTVDAITQGTNFSQQPNQTLSQLQSGVSLGTNPAQATAGNIASGAQVGQAPGQSTLTAGQNYTNPGIAATQQAINGINANYTNPANAQAANYNQYTNAATGLQTQQANALASGNNPAMDMLQKTANGDFLNSNPYLQEAINKANSGLVAQFKNEIAPGIDSQFARAGRLGSGAFAAARNNAEGTLASAMSKNANDIMMQNYTQERQNQLNAQNSYGNLYNQDQQNQMQANANLANTSNSQQGQRLAGTDLYGNLNNAQENIRQNASGMQLQGAGQIGSLGNQQQGLRQDAANSLNSQYQFDKNYQMQGLGLQNDIYQQGIGNQFKNNDQRMNAANSQFTNQNAQANTQLQGASMAGDMYGLNYLPSQQLAQVGAQRDAYLDLLKQAEVNKWDRQQQQPITNVAQMLNFANGGGYNNQTTPVHSNSLGQGLGLLTALAGLL